MTLRIADFLTITTADDNGTDIPRYTNFRAVIPLDENRRYTSNGGQVTIRIEVDDAHIDGDDQTSYLFEADIPAAHVNDNPSDFLTAALDVLAAEGFELAGPGWSASSDRFTARIEAIAKPAPEVVRVVELLASSAYPKVAEHALGVSSDVIDTAIAWGLVRVVRVQPTLAKPGGERMLAVAA